MVKTDVLVLKRHTRSLFLRCSASAGTSVMFDVGTGIYITPDIYFSSSYAYLKSPKNGGGCGGFFAPSLKNGSKMLESVQSSLLLTAGVGRHGMLLELNFFIFFKPELYQRYDCTNHSPITNYQYTPGAFAIRLGYSI